MDKHAKAKVPAIRFKGFEGEWQEQQIGEVLEEKQRPIVLNDNQKYELITVKRRNAGVVSRGHLFGKEILVKNYFQLKENDFVVSKRQVVHGATGIIPKNLNDAIVSNEYLVVEDNEKLSTEFLNLLSCLPKMKNDFFLSSYGVDIEKLFFDFEDWKKRLITIPGKVEQVKLSAFFKQLDANLELHQSKLDKLNTLKRVMLQKMFPQDDATVPEIRFQGFAGDWQKNQLGSITDPVSSNTLSRGDLNYQSGQAKNIHYGDILVQFGEVLEPDESSVPFVSSDEIVSALKHAKLITGDIVFADTAEDESVGKCVELVNVGENLVLSGLHTITVRPRIPFATAYLGYYLNSGSYRRQLLPLMQGTKVLSLSRTSLASTHILFPDSLEEQFKIGNYFRRLDELIALERVRFDKLKQIKQSCLAGMFV